MSPQDFIPSIYVYIILTLGMEWPDFCAEKEFIRKEIAEAISKRGGFVEVKQIVFMKSDEHCSSVFHQEQMLSSLKNNEDQFIEVNLFLMDKKGNYDFNLTETCGALMQLEADDSENTIGNRKVYRVQVEFKTNEERDPVYPPADNPRKSSSRANIVVIIVASIASVCVVLLAILLAIMKQRLKKAGGCEPSHQEAYSLDSFPTAANVRRKKSRFSMRSFLNQAFDDPDEPSHPLNFTGLTNFTCNGQAMEDEFKSIPMNMPRMDQVPTGAEVKNRYANVIPEPKTRVPLTLIKGEPNSNYINANFVRGYGGQAKFYIACQAPLPETVPDFWRMVWEQQSKVIVMLTQWEEDGVARCAPYFSENIVDCHRVFGDFQVSLQKTDVQENYTISTLRLYNLEVSPPFCHRLMSLFVIYRRLSILEGLSKGCCISE
ncbi:receptor-type tyrosine-protein phosphatase alpha-like [Limulus polyphemus]|uniref:protein-tyrosine-phosphatase n=1 Tax=Limulus polyphemus TaxID=6850 RepID=A0ABM1TPM9_LIMPO|nr:receptor-type tyrosine-protein phosphatase alpha-like [Limulus polyphemus]